MLENFNMKQKIILEDVETILNLSREADSIFDKLLQILVKVIQKPETIKDVILNGTTYTGEKAFLINPIYYKELYPNTKSLKIFLGNGKDEAGYYTHKQLKTKNELKHQIILQYLPSKIKTNEDLIEGLKKIVQKSKFMRSTFIHEYTHLFDNMRTRSAKFFSKPYTKEIEKEIMDGNLSNYYKIPYEYNAHMLEGTNKLRRKIVHFYTYFNDLDESKQKEALDNIKKELPKHPTESVLKTILKEFWKRDFIDEILKDEKFKKKIYLRIYDLYLALTKILYDKLPEHPKS